MKTERTNTKLQNILLIENVRKYKSMALDTAIIQRNIPSICKFGFLSSLVIILYLAFTSTPIPSGNHQDKLHHIFAFWVLFLLLDHGWLNRTQLTFTPAYLLPRILLLTAYGIFIEITQSMLPNRHGSWLDLGADLAGIALYLISLHYALKNHIYTTLRRSLNSQF